MSTTLKTATDGFGAPRQYGAHHFLVDIPAATAGVVSIVEDFGFAGGDSGAAHQETRVVLPRPIWTGIAAAARRDFNTRLKERKLSTGRWTVGKVKLDRLLGKELCVLAWAAETAGKEELDVIARRWESLRPEERWWLFSVTVAETGRAEDTHRGWRRALYHALSDPGARGEVPARRAQTPLTESDALPLFSD